MELTDIDKNLLSLLLALKDLECSLSDNAKSVLAQASEELNTKNLRAWEELTIPCLLKMIETHPSLKELFQIYKSQLDKLDKLKDDLLPSHTELERVSPTEQTKPLARALPEISPQDLKSNEITNMVIRIMATPDPSETVKKISRFEQLKQFVLSL